MFALASKVPRLEISILVSQNLELRLYGVIELSSAVSMLLPQ